MISSVAVLGAGQMGSGIAQAAATVGYRTVVQDVLPLALDKSLAAVARSLSRFVEKGEMTAAERDAVLGRVEFTTDLGAAGRADIVIEAIVERLDAKLELWRAIDSYAGPSTIFASNTSSLPIATLAAATRRPDRFLGLHFFNPVPIMPLVEVVRALGTSQQTLDVATDFIRRLGKEPVETRDTPGFVVNRLLVPYLLDAIRTLEQGIASTVDIDTAMRLGAGHPMGPLTLADFVGLDTLASIGDIMFGEYGESRYVTPPLLRRMVSAGLHGRKTGRGFYDYALEPPQPIALA